MYLKTCHWSHLDGSRGAIPFFTPSHVMLNATDESLKYLQASAGTLMGKNEKGIDEQSLLDVRSPARGHGSLRLQLSPSTPLPNSHLSTN